MSFIRARCQEESDEVKFLGSKQRHFFLQFEGNLYIAKWIVALDYKLQSKLSYFETNKFDLLSWLIFC